MTDIITPYPCSSGMSQESFVEFMKLVMLGVERMSKRQRYEFRIHTKKYAKLANIRWPVGKSDEECKNDMMEARIKEQTKIIVPEAKR